MANICSTGGVASSRTSVREKLRKAASIEADKAMPDAHGGTYYIYEPILYHKPI
jgi:hypothetical protein